MAVRLSEVVVDCADPERVARFWSAVLGWPVRRWDEDGEVYFDLEPPSPGIPELAFVPVPEPKTAKVRIHLDVRPVDGATRDEEVERILALGATRADVGQSEDVSWVVLADVEGNEFCVLGVASTHDSAAR
ncbi:putative enzyme related to lactoylglutathione lyase [Motilibacter peucedani]|uniref:Putative enzyme related to lactoylglutathione lyase n=1 Tax=Motilibacter peucedani TaxID=598650 RepID=A0A420XLH2_9ACTN|nr:VOC family protein [Motilibacter peucedani]RKS69390.1 putative enzyme related to lactoylglutathione lyase [Motilibacter peucedani]